MSKYAHVIWDWNGTLLDDVELCLTTVNTLLMKRRLQPIKDINAYRDIFGFPVIDYYRRAGFDFGKEPFEIPAAGFIELYHSDSSQFRLFDGAAETLASVKEIGTRQVILSASELNNLLSQTGLFDIEHYLDDIIGISNIYAESKVNVGREYIVRNNIDSSKAVLIGDTVHDYEEVKTLGIDCILIANGHQNKSKLLDCGVLVINEIKDVVGGIQ